VLLVLVAKSFPPSAATAPKNAWEMIGESVL